MFVCCFFSPYLSSSTQKVEEPETVAKQSCQICIQSASTTAATKTTLQCWESQSQALYNQFWNHTNQYSARHVNGKLRIIMF